MISMMRQMTKKKLLKYTNIKKNVIFAITKSKDECLFHILKKN